MYILTHRGLNPSEKKYFLENSYESFEDCLRRGFGLEVDLQFTKDNEIVIWHDSTLERLSKGIDKRAIIDLTLKEITELTFENCRIIHLDELFSLLLNFYSNGQNRQAFLAIHLKGKLQNKKNLDILIEKTRECTVPHSQFIIFDLTPESAAYLKENNKNLQLAASVSHPFDVSRYNSCVSGTLLSTDEIIKYKNIYDWAWLDEWDRTDSDNKTKKLYTQNVFSNLRENGLKIALVSPELHSSSPGLLGGESHHDGTDKNRLSSRIQEFILLEPDAVCTDYPDMLKKAVCNKK